VRPDAIDAHHVLATEAHGSPADPRDDAATGISRPISQENMVLKLEPFGERPEVRGSPDVAPDVADCRCVGMSDIQSLTGARLAPARGHWQEEGGSKQAVMMHGLKAQ
jgi:hypothetical protein